MFSKDIVCGKYEGMLERRQSRKDSYVIKWEQ